jgi:hypothetical protein
MRVFRAVLVAAGLVAAAAQWDRRLAGEVSHSCSYTDAASGSTYDVSSLTLSGGQLYNVSDKFDPSTRYAFNVCGDVNIPDLPVKCQTSCNEVTGVAPGGTCPGYQMEDLAHEQTCYALSDAASHGWEWSLWGELCLVVWLRQERCSFAVPCHAQRCPPWRMHAMEYIGGICVVVLGKYECFV